MIFGEKSYCKSSGIRFPCSKGICENRTWSLQKTGTSDKKNWEQNFSLKFWVIGVK